MAISLKNKPYKAQGFNKMKRGIYFYPLVLGFLLIFSLSFVSAVSKSYNEETNTATIKNTILGIPTSEVATAKLDTPKVYQVIAGRNRLVAEFTISLKENSYSNALEKIDFYDLKNNNNKIERNFTYKYKFITGQKEVNDFITVCTDDLINKRTSCEDKVIGTHKEDIYEWRILNTKNLVKGNITIGIFTDVARGDKIEWIPTFFGQKIQEWATWTDGLDNGLVTYHRFDLSSTNATFSLDSIGLYNASVNSTNLPTRGATGKLAQAFNYSISGATYLVTTSSSRLHNQYNFSVNVWVNTTTLVNGQTILGTTGEMGGLNTFEWYLWGGAGTTGAGPRVEYVHNKGSNQQWEATVSTAGKDFVQGDWQMITIMNNQSGGYLYLNGVYIASDTNTEGLYLTDGGIYIGTGGTIRTGGNRYLNGIIDEFAYWNRSLTQSEITQLYNGGDGITYRDYLDHTLRTYLRAPNNGQIIIGTNSSFNVSIDPTNLNITNSTLYVWRTNGTIFNTTTNLVTGNVTNETLFKMYNFSAGNYLWNVLTCGTNGTIVCDWALNNFSIYFRPFVVNSENFNFTTYETLKETISLNFTKIGTVLSITPTLNYNGTKFSGDISCSGTDCIVQTHIDIPIISGEQQNKTFFWEFATYDGSSVFFINTTSHYQNISAIHLAPCDATYTIKAFNFTAYQEPNLTRITPYSFGGTFYYWLGNGLTYKNLTINNNTAAENLLCMLPASNGYKLNAQIIYGDGGNSYDDRDYYFSNYQYGYNNNISLYLLPKTSSTSFIIKVQDNSLNPIGDAYVYIQRYYPATNTFQTVQVVKTSQYGKSVGFFETETADYRFIIIKNGITLLSTGIQKVVPEETPYTLTFTIGTTQNPMSAFDTIAGLTSVLTYNSTTKLVSYQYIDSLPTFTQGRLYIELINATGNNKVLCNSTSALSTALLTCNLAGQNGTIQALAYNTREGIETLDKTILVTLSKVAETFGFTGVLIAFFIVLVSGMAFMWGIAAGVIAIDVALLLIQILGLVSFGWVFLFSMFIISIIVIIGARQ